MIGWYFKLDLFIVCCALVSCGWLLVLLICLISLCRVVIGVAWVPG